jgi:hypothetical protein
MALFLDTPSHTHARALLEQWRVQADRAASIAGGERAQ